LIVYQIVKRDPVRHYWIVVLSTAELYGGCVFPFWFTWWPTEIGAQADDDFFSTRSWMTFCPEWLTGSPSLDTSNPLFFWVYLVVSFLFPSPVPWCATRVLLTSISPGSL
jgi:hypothetical protein